MTFLATTRCDILRGSAPATNGIGDEVDVDTVAIANKRISIIEKKRSTFDTTSQTWRSVAYFAARLDPTVDVRDGDRVKDRRTGTIYAIDQIKRTGSTIAGQRQLLLELRDPSRLNE